MRRTECDCIVKAGCDRQMRAARGGAKESRRGAKRKDEAARRRGDRSVDSLAVFDTSSRDAQQPTAVEARNGGVNMTTVKFHSQLLIVETALALVRVLSGLISAG